MGEEPASPALDPKSAKGSKLESALDKLGLQKRKVSIHNNPFLLQLDPTTLDEIYLKYLIISSFPADFIDFQFIF